MSDTVKAGSCAVITHIAKQEGLYDILCAVYGKAHTATMLDVLSCILTGGSAVFSRYEAFLRCHMISSFPDDRALSHVLRSQHKVYTVAATR